MVDNRRVQDPFAGVLPFVHVAEARSFRRAAEQLGVTAAAISKAVAKLEDELGVRLLDRTTRRVEPTREGALFLEHCRGALGQVVTGRARIAEAQRAPSGDVTVTLPFILGRHLVAALPELTHRLPALRLHLRLTDRMTRLVDEHIDVAIRIGPLPDSTLIARKVADTRWATVASPAYLARRAAPQVPADLTDHDCLVFHNTRGRDATWTFRARPRSRERITVAPPARIDVDQGDLLVDAALAGLGVAQVMSYMVDDHLRAGRLVEVLADHACEALPIHALCKPGQQNAAKIRAVLDFVARAFG